MEKTAATAIASLLACLVAASEAATTDKWFAFGDDPITVEVESDGPCKVMAGNRIQGWAPGGSEKAYFRLVDGRGMRMARFTTEASAKPVVRLLSAEEAATAPVSAKTIGSASFSCRQGWHWIYRLKDGNSFTFAARSVCRGFPSASFYCVRPGSVKVRWGGREQTIVGDKEGYVPFDPVALTTTDSIEFVSEGGEFELTDVGFTTVRDPLTDAEMQEICQRLCDSAVAEGLQGGVQFCAYRHGRKIVDVCAGHLTTNAGSAAVRSDSLFPIFSTEKPLLATACHRAVERGLMDYDRPLCTWWPELRGYGKEKLTLRETLAYRTCLPGGAPGGKDNPVVGRQLTELELCDWDLVCRVAAADRPSGVPGTVQAYLPYAYAWMVGHPLEVAMKKPLKQVLDEEVLIPAGIEKEFYFVVPREEYPRVASFYYGQFCENMNEDWARQAILPSAWAVSSAAALCRFYNRLCGFDGKAPLIRKETLDAALRPCRHPSDPLPSPESMRRDWFMIFGMGYGLWGEAERMDRVFGHGGAGGSEALVDRDNELVVAYTCNFCKNCIALRDQLYGVVGMRWRYWNDNVNIQDLQMTTSSGGSFGSGIKSR